MMIEADPPLLVSCQIARIVRSVLLEPFQRDEHFVDPRSVHVDDLEVEVAPRQFLSRMGDMFQLFENQTAERVVVVVVVEVLMSKWARKS